MELPVVILDLPALEPGVQHLIKQRELEEITHSEYFREMENLGYTWDEATELDPIPQINERAGELRIQRKFGEIDQEEFVSMMMDAGYTSEEALELDPGRLEG